MFTRLPVLLAFQTAFCVAAFAAMPLPKGYEIAENSTSPNGKYCVIQPTRAVYLNSLDPNPETIGANGQDILSWIQSYSLDSKTSGSNGQPESSKAADAKIYNAIVETTTGKIIAKINAKCMMKGVASPSVGIRGGAQWNTDHALWSSDSSTLVWTVDGKWGPDSITVVRLANRHVISQTDLRTPIDSEMLKRTKRAHPKICREFAHGDANGMGTWYPEGFTIDIQVVPFTASNKVTFTAGLVSELKWTPPDTEKEASDSPWYQRADEMVVAFTDGSYSTKNGFEYQNYRSYTGKVLIAQDKASFAYKKAYGQLAAKLSESERKAFEKSETDWGNTLSGDAGFSFSLPQRPIEDTAKYQKHTAELEKRAASISH